MPTHSTKNGVKRWRGQVRHQGVQKTKWFGPGPKGGQEYKKALLWEEKARASLSSPQIAPGTPTICSVDLLEWGNEYLSECKRDCVSTTLSEKTTDFRRLFEFVDPSAMVAEFTTPKAKRVLQNIHDKYGPNQANKARKNLGAGWRWACKFMEGFVLSGNPFLDCPKYKAETSPRYVPSEDDFWKVYDHALGQDKLLLLIYLHTAARKAEVFRLKWDDIDFHADTLRLSTRKAKEGIRYDTLPLTPELRAELLKWWECRPHKASPYVFTVIGDYGFETQYEGRPFTSRQHFMKKLCLKAGVKPFGFHAIRHLAASIQYRDGMLQAEIQAVLRHSNPSTTNRYLHSLGLENVRQKLGEVMSDRRHGKVVEFNKRGAIA